MKDYYKILEVSENSSDEEIKKSYRRLSKQYHPDVNPDGAEKFKEIAEAYEVLGDPQKKQSYDNSKNNPFEGMGDMFSHMFGNNPFNRQRRKSAPDKMVKVQITPIESYLSVDKTIQYSRDIHCDACSGSGGDKETCRTCNGQGFQIRNFGNGFIIQQVRIACPSCNGQGYTLITKCYKCNGKGTNMSVNTVNIKIPHGADDGQFLKLENQGDFRNGEYGDLVLQLEMTSKDGFEKMNNDLIYTLFLNKEQIDDNKYSIPHPEGELSITSPKIFDTSKPLRIKGRGYRGGDMYVKLNVKFNRSE